MIKKLIALISAAAFGLHCQSQPIIQASEIARTIGDVYPISVCIGTDPGSAGENQTWDFSNLVPFDTDMLEIVDPANTAAALDFPDATSVTYTESQEQYVYTDFENGAYVHYGGVYGQTSIPYSDPEVFCNFPMEFGNTNTDQFLGTYVNQIPFERSGSTSSEVDGYGTLITPYNTYTDVLRLKLIQDYQDVRVGTSITSSYLSTVYHWYKAGVGYPVMINIDWEGPNSTYSRVQYLDAPSSIENQESITLNVYPNPAQDFLSIRQHEFSKSTFRMVDTQGKVVHEGVVNNSIIDLRSVESGLYVLMLISNDDLVGTCRFSVLK